MAEYDYVEGKWMAYSSTHLYGTSDDLLEIVIAAEAHNASVGFWPVGMTWTEAIGWWRRNVENKRRPYLFGMGYHGQKDVTSDG